MTQTHENTALRNYTVHYGDPPSTLRYCLTPAAIFESCLEFRRNNTMHISSNRGHKSFLRLIACHVILFNCKCFELRFRNRPPAFPETVFIGACALCGPWGKACMQKQQVNNPNPLATGKRHTSCISETQCTLECTSVHFDASMHAAQTMDA